jgi:hypothetical protein
MKIYKEMYKKLLNVNRFCMLFTESCGCASKTPKKRKKKELENEHNEASVQLKKISSKPHNVCNFYPNPNNSTKKLKRLA